MQILITIIAAVLVLFVLLVLYALLAMVKRSDTIYRGLPDE